MLYFFIAIKFKKWHKFDNIYHFSHVKSIYFNMKKEYIIFVDSGVGGLSTLSETYKQVSGNFLYFADNKNCPYGSKSRAKIKKILTNHTKRFTALYNVRVIVLACNTATTTAIKCLRKTFPDVCFIGTEPAVKLASDMGYSHIVSLLTPATAKQKKYLKLVKMTNTNIKTVASVQLAPRVEISLTKKTLNQDFLLAKTTFSLKPRMRGADAVVLGCTHFTLVSGKLSKIFGLPTVDGNKGVADHALLVTKNLSATNNINFYKNKHEFRHFFDNSCSFRDQNKLKNKNQPHRFFKMRSFCHAKILGNNVVLKPLASRKIYQISHYFLKENSIQKLTKIKSIKFNFSKDDGDTLEKYIKIFKQTLAISRKLC